MTATLTSKVTLPGLDVYRGDDPLDFHAAVAAGMKYFFLKATQGNHYSDVDYAGFRTRANSVGLPIGAYHFYEPKMDPILQAEHFLAVAKPTKGDLFPVLDIETFGPNVGELALKCADHIKAKLGVNPIIYSGDSFFQSYLKTYFDEFTKWIARYGYAPVTTCQFWQNSDSAHITGIPHALDRDVFYGDETALKAYCLC